MFQKSTDLKSVRINYLHLLLIGLFSFLHLTLVYAQDPSDLVLDSIPAEETVPFSDIIIRSTSDLQSIDEMNTGLYTDEQLESFRNNVDSLIAEINSVKDDKGYALKEEDNLHHLDKVKRKWLSLSRKINNEVTQLAGRMDLLNENRSDLIAMRELWTATRKSITEVRSFDVLNERVTSILESSDSLEHKINKQIESIILLQDKLANYSIDAEKLIRYIDERLNKRAVSMIGIDDAPLWDFEKQVSDTLGLFDQVNVIIKDEVSPLLQFTREFKQEIFLQLSVFIFLLIITVIIYTKIRKRTLLQHDEVNAERIRNIFSYPVSISVLISSYTTLFIYKTAPPLFMEIIILIILLSILMIIPRIFSWRDSLIIYCLMAAFLITRLLGITFVQSYSVRMLLLVTEASSALLIYGAIISPYLSRSHLRPRMQSVLKLLGFLALFVLAGATISNIVGAVKLSFILSSGVLRGIVAGILFYISMIVVQGLVLIILNSRFINDRGVFRQNAQVIRKYSRGIVNIFFVLLWFNTLLKIFNIHSDMMKWAGDFLNDKRSVGALEFTMGDIFLFILIIYLSILISRIIKAVLEDEILPQLSLKKGLGATIGTMTKYILVTAGFFIAVSASGMSLDKLTVLIGAFGVGIGFGLQNIINNLISGLILLFERPIQVNDTIEVGTLIGNVKKIGIRSSHIRTFDGAEVIVPNGEFISKEVVNWTHSDQRRRIELIVGVAYGSDVHKVKVVLKKVLDDHKEVIKHPPPSILFNELNESSLDFRLLFWTDNYDEWLRIRSEVVFNVYDALNEAGISIPFPQRDIYIKEFRSEKPKNNNSSDKRDVDEEQ